MLSNRLLNCLCLSIAHSHPWILFSSNHHLSVAHVFYALYIWCKFIVIGNEIATMTRLTYPTEFNHLSQHLTTLSSIPSISWHRCDCYNRWVTWTFHLFCSCFLVAYFQMTREKPGRYKIIKLFIDLRRQFYPSSSFYHPNSKIDHHWIYIIKWFGDDRVFNLCWNCPPNNMMWCMYSYCVIVFRFHLYYHYSRRCGSHFVCDKIENRYPI